MGCFQVFNSHVNICTADCSSIYVYLTEDTIQRLNMTGHIFLTWNHSKTYWDHGLLCGSRCGYQLDGVCLSMYAAQNVCGLTFIDHLAGQLIVVCGIIIFVIPLMHRYYLIGIRLLSLHFFEKLRQDRSHPSVRERKRRAPRYGAEHCICGRPVVMPNKHWVWSGEKTDLAIVWATEALEDENHEKKNTDPLGVAVNWCQMCHLLFLL